MLLAYVGLGLLALGAAVGLPTDTLIPRKISPSDPCKPELPEAPTSFKSHFKNSCEALRQIRQEEKQFLDHSYSLVRIVSGGFPNVPQSRGLYVKNLEEARHLMQNSQTSFDHFDRELSKADDSLRWAGRQWIHHVNLSALSAERIQEISAYVLGFSGSIVGGIGTSSFLVGALGTVAMAELALIQESDRVFTPDPEGKSF